MGVAGMITHRYYGSFPHSRSEAPVRLKNSRKPKLFSFQDLSHSEFLSQHGQMAMAAFFWDISSHLPVAIHPQEIILSGICHRKKNFIGDIKKWPEIGEIWGFLQIQRWKSQRPAADGISTCEHLEWKRMQSIYILVGGWATPLKNISQLGWLFPMYGKISKCSKPPTREYNLPLFYGRSLLLYHRVAVYWLPYAQVYCNRTQPSVKIWPSGKIWRRWGHILQDAFRDFRDKCLWFLIPYEAMILFFAT